MDQVPYFEISDGKDAIFQTIPIKRSKFDCKHILGDALRITWCSLCWNHRECLFTQPGDIPVWKLRNSKSWRISQIGKNRLFFLIERLGIGRKKCE